MVHRKYTKLAFTVGEMGTRQQQYSSVKVHSPKSNERRKIQCLVVSLVFAITIAVLFFVLYLVKKKNEVLEIRTGCADATCVEIAAGNLI